MTIPSQQHQSLSQLLAHLSPLFRQHRIRLLLGFICLVSVDFLQLAIPRILKRGIDAIAQGHVVQTDLLRYGGAIIGVAILVVALRFIWRYAIIGFSRYLEQNLRDRIFSHIIDLDAAFFEKRTTGDIMAHSSNDLASIQLACGMGLVSGVDALVMSLAAIAFMATLHLKLTLLALMPLPFLAICTKILAAKMHTRFTSVQEQFALLTEFSRSTLVSIRLIKAYTMEHFQTLRFDSIGKAYLHGNLAVARVQGILFPLSSLIGNLGLCIILLYGGRLAILGTLSIGEFVAFITYLAMLIWPMMAIGWVANLSQRGITSLRRIDTLLSERPILHDRADTGLHVLSPHIRCNHLSFSYPESSQQVLNDIDVTFSPGLHGIAGRTGSGKSTLCKLLVRLYQIDKGTLYFQDQDVQELSLYDVRSHIAYVAQEPVLFSDTIAANISFNDPHAKEEDIRRAAQIAAIDKEIIAFPEGYATSIGERGIKLSGGQRQRLALARAIYTERPVLIIDDGLSAVDVETEHHIFQSLYHHLQGKTVIFVSNRIKLLSMTDRILILENGHFTAQGDHEYLLDHNDFYRVMYEKQMRTSGVSEQRP